MEHGIIVDGVELEIRQEGRRPTLRAVFPYGVTATISDRGRVRKERFIKGAFRFAIEEVKAGRREIDLLVGHSFDKPIASTRANSLTVREATESVIVEATLPPEGQQPSWIVDLLASVTFGLMTGLSPGFSVPPPDVVPNAEAIVPEEGNPGVMIRDIAQAVLHEFSIVTRPAYKETSVDLRAMQDAATTALKDSSNQAVAERAYRWL